ncbi:chemotaxis protein CheB [Rhodoferax sediminis]|uniref:protein-glutamate O-methyltransferase n=1 Tax=Rhodoferax sediminis TaxID=2509614 RepID=A0A515D8Q0_9BURK|nr:chemotaxis protein CheB [Rhodoferax sediminis]QDL36782.1 PAS domain S-box protein [Rhodoferax sediminis]
MTTTQKGSAPEHPAPESGKSSEAQPPVELAAADFPIVGIGASAGGLAAIEAFFSGMPADSDPGMAFVLVQHLAPDHTSILTELVQRTTRMKVFEVQDGMAVQVNCVYIIPPNRDMAFLNGTLQLLEPSAPRGHRLPIDFLFRSLAQDQHERAIGIVLSGTGSDGTLGVRAIKGEGGMVMVQNPDSCEFDGMPRSAVATGLVDYELPPAEMAVQLLAYVGHAFGKPPRVATVAAPQNENALKKIFILLHTQTGHDFSHYKTSTIYRRIERRMAVHQVDSIDSYVKYLQQTPLEAQELFRDLLIGVTNFFRDPEAFEVLEKQVIPKLFDGKTAGAVIRVWSAGCSTGEEAYSIAILLQERLDLLRQSYKVQLFATDIDSRAIATARAGIYPANIAGDISPARLARFFTAESDGSAYRVRKGLRDMLVFSEHDLIKDPPFSKLDLISCRNVLIYMGTDLQKKLIALFHYALMPGGMLFLGTSETVGELSGLFAVLDRKAKVYQSKEDFQGPKRTAISRVLSHLQPATARNGVRALMAGPTTLPTRKPSLRELTEQALLQQVSPAGALVNDQGDILYLHGRTGMFLEPAAGDAGINNILKMSREGLRRDLTTALHKAAITNERVRTPGLRVKTNGHFTLVNLTVCPLTQGVATALESSLFLVILEEAPAPDAHEGPQAVLPFIADKDAGAQIAELNEEIRTQEEHLHAANEELETSNEELKSSNEELQSVNEELQSTNEELETSKEELQSINEELATVNTELQTKVTDLSRANNDMNNLLAGTGIGTVFVDHDLRILRFTPAATPIIHLIQSDVGRPIAHLASNLVGYDNLVADSQSVLKTLLPKEIDVMTTEGKSYTLRILPYRTLDNVIEGAVITFVEITEMVRAREALRAANELARLAVVVRDAFDAITVQDLDGRIIAWNPGAVRMYGWTETEALKMNVRSRIPAALQQESLASMHRLSHSETLEPYQTQRIAKDGSIKDISLTSTALVNESGQMYAIATTERTLAPKITQAVEARNASPE